MNLKQKTLLVFDLDGTLIDSLDDLTSAINLTLGDFNFPLKTKAHVRWAIGHGARTLLEKCIPEELIPQVDDYYPQFIQNYDLCCSQQTRLYDGVLEFLKTNTQRKALLTNKPQKATEKVLLALGISDYFECVIGGDILETRKPDPQGLHYILEKLKVTIADSVMIGDGVPDILVANAIQMDSIAILEGLGEEQDLLQAQPTQTIRKFTELKDL
jgi:phosphoglycolate phosphatase